MAKNPFDDDEGTFYALMNHEEQHSLWPTFKPVPGGWAIVYGAPDGAPRQEVLDWIDANWTDIRPKSLRDHIARSEAARSEPMDGDPESVDVPTEPDSGMGGQDLSRTA